MRNRNRLISALPVLSPTAIVDVQTGEFITPSELQAKLGLLAEYVQSETRRLYAENAAKLLKEVKLFRGSANSYGRQRGYKSDYSILPTNVKAKSRINELVLHKLISETATYVANPNPHKQEHSFNSTLNLGAADKQMVTLAVDGDLLTLILKCWDSEYYLEFTIPQYVLLRSIKKWSLPLIVKRKDKFEFIFTVEEHIPERPAGNHNAGVDLGVREPYVLAVTNKTGARVAHYNTSTRLKQLNNKRERLLFEKKHLTQKIKAYSELGLDNTILRQNSDLVSDKASRLGVAIAKHVGNEVATKLHKHQVGSLHVENLTWVSGVKSSKIGSSRWTQSQQQSYITSAALRKGVVTKKVNPKNSSQACHKCGTHVTYDSKTRSVHCSACKSKIDRDFNAAMNLASLNHLRCPLLNRGKGEKDSPEKHLWVPSAVPNSVTGKHATIVALVT